MNLDGSVVLITGASSGIGAVTAKSLAARGARVVLCARNAASLAHIAQTIESDGAQALACAADVTVPEDMRRAVAAAVERFGRLDVFVANAGVATVGPLTDGLLEDWDRMIDVNLRGVLHGVAAALPVFKAQGSGQFVVVSSTSAIKFVPGQGVYAATKAGVRALCEVLRQELVPDVRVTMVCPGATLTEMTSSDGDPLLAAQYRAIAMEPDAVAAAIGYAISAPPEVNVGEIVVRSAKQQ